LITKKSPSPIDVYVGSRMRMRRTMLGMSQEKLGEAFGVSFQQVQKYEKGTNRMSSSRLQQATNVLGVPVSFFFEDLPDTQVSGYTEPWPGYVNEFVSSHDGLRLIKAFTSIENDAMRRRIVSLVQELAVREQD
jgi:transcriptional regulator with XRE-family HTH domain